MLLFFFHVPVKTVLEKKMVFMWLLEVPGYVMLAGFV